MEKVDSGVAEFVEVVRRFGYGRPSDGSDEAMLREGRGTCSAKHRYLARRVAEDFPDLEPRIVHRVYRVDRERARKDFGEQVAAVVPLEGLVDVHRYLTLNERGFAALAVVEEVGALVAAASLGLSAEQIARLDAAV